MADSAVAITAGSGTSIDTRTESTNSNHRQVIVVGDPSTNAGVAPVDGTAGLKVDLGSDNDVVATNGGTFVVQEDGDALTALQLIDDIVYADDADWSDGTSKHALIGGVYQSTPQSITDGDTGPLSLDANGRARVLMTHGVAAGDFAKAEDAAHTSADVGVPAFAVRRDAKAVGSGTDGDYSTLNVSANGDLRVDGGDNFIVRVAPTVTAGAYSADDSFGGEQTIANAARISGGGGVLQKISMVAEDNDADGFSASDIDVMIFESNPGGTYTDNATIAGTGVIDADGPLLLAVVPLSPSRKISATSHGYPQLTVSTSRMFAAAQQVCLRLRSIAQV